MYLQLGHLGLQQFDLPILEGKKRVVTSKNGKQTERFQYEGAIREIVSGISSLLTRPYNSEYVYVVQT